MVLETVQNLKNRIIFKIYGQFQSGLPIFRKKKINWNLRRTQPKVESHQRADFEHINHWFLLKVVIQ